MTLAASAAPRTTIPTGRLVACYATILGTLPYLTLKISWIAGGTIGVRQASFVDSSTLRFANIVTAGMDAVAILLAFALTYSWGRRLPAPLVLFPAWIGSGLLLPIVLCSPVIGADLVTATDSLPLENWVFGMVYGGFAWQGIALLTAFALYARDRWPHLRTAFVRPSAYAWVGAVLATSTALLHLAWAFGSTFALSPRMVDPSVSAHVMDGIDGALALIAVVALLTAGRLWPRLVAVWAGSAAMVGWGAWMLFSTLTTGALDAPGTLAQAGAYALQVTAGALVITTHLSRRPAAQRV